MRFAGISLSNYMDGFDNTLLSNTSQEARSQEKRSGMVAEGKVSAAGIAGQADMQAAKYGASAARAAGNAAGNAAMFGGAMDAVGSLGSAGISKMNTFKYAGGPGSKGTKLGAGGGIVGDTGTLGPNYGIPQYGWRP